MDDLNSLSRLVGGGLRIAVVRAAKQYAAGKPTDNCGYAVELARNAGEFADRNREQ